MIFVIAFKDCNEEHYYRKEILDKNNDFLEYGEVEEFETREEAKDFLLENCDVRAYDFYVKELKESDE